MYSSPQKEQAFRTRAANSVPIRARQIRQMSETNRVGDMQSAPPCKTAPQLLAEKGSKSNLLSATARGHTQAWSSGRTIDFRSGQRSPVSLFYHSLAAWPRISSLKLSRPVLFVEWGHCHLHYRIIVNTQGKVAKMWRLIYMLPTLLLLTTIYMALTMCKALLCNSCNPHNNPTRQVLILQMKQGKGKSFDQRHTAENTRRLSKDIKQEDY